MALGANTLNDQNIEWQSPYSLKGISVALSHCGLGFIRVLRFAVMALRLIPRPPCDSDEVRWEFVTRNIMYKCSMIHSWDVVVLTFFSTSIGKRSKVDRSASHFGRCLKFMELQGMFSVVCESPRNRGWPSMSIQLDAPRPAIHGRQSTKVGTMRPRAAVVIGFVWLFPIPHSPFPHSPSPHATSSM